jgi:hypothetical protein
MRTFQLAEIVKKYLGSKFNIVTCAQDFSISDSILIISKWLALTLTKEQANKLKSQGNKIIFDMVDTNIDQHRTDIADLVIASSEGIANDYQKIINRDRVIVIDHHVDPRVQALRHHPISQFKLGYFGEKENAYFTDKIAQKVDIFSIDTSSQRNNEWINSLNKYNIHYSIRRTNDRYSYKPFLKGFTAAYCDSNIVVHEGDSEAIYWLGDDYPFIIRGPINESNILNSLDKFRGMFNTKEWYDGLKKMKEIKEKINDRHVAIQFEAMLRKVG